MLVTKHRVSRLAVLGTLFGHVFWAVFIRCDCGLCEMALDILGPDAIEVDGFMSRPSDPMPCERKCSGVFAPIAFSVRKSFWGKFLKNGGTSGTSGTSVVFAEQFSAHFGPFVPLRVRRARPFALRKTKTHRKTYRGLTPISCRSACGYHPHARRLCSR